MTRGEGTVPEEVHNSDPFYAVQDPETGDWLLILMSLRKPLREAILDETKGDDVGEDWRQLRSPVWAVNVLHMQAEDGSAEAREIVGDKTRSLAPMPEGWQEFVWRHFDASDPAWADI
jgi:hypothetical protein